MVSQFASWPELFGVQLPKKFGISLSKSWIFRVILPWKKLGHDADWDTIRHLITQIETPKIRDFDKEIPNLSGNFTPKKSGHDADWGTIRHLLNRYDGGIGKLKVGIEHSTRIFEISGWQTCGGNSRSSQLRLPVWRGGGHRQTNVIRRKEKTLSWH